MQIESKDLCPLNNFEKCRQLDCAWFIQLRGNNPNTGKEVDEWGCAMAWQPILTVDNTRETRATGAAVESFRNEIAAANQPSLIKTIANKQNDIKEITK